MWVDFSIIQEGGELGRGNVKKKGPQTQRPGHPLTQAAELLEANLRSLQGFSYLG